MALLYSSTHLHMKNNFILLIISALIPSFLKAQVVEETRLMSLGSNPAFTTLITGTDTKFVDAEWREYMKIYGKTTKVKQTKETVTPDIQIVSIGGISRLNVYNLNEIAPEGVKTYVWIRKDSAFINSSSNPEEYKAGASFVKEFAHKIKVDLINNELELEQKNLAKLENNQAKLVKENEGLHKLIDDTNKKISQAGIDIETNLVEQEKAEKDIDHQKETVSDVQKREGVTAKEIDAQVKTLSKYENNLTKLKKENDNLHKLIEDSHKKITQAEADIETNLGNQDLAKKEIENQTGIVEGVQKKLDAAKKEKL